MTALANEKSAGVVTDAPALATTSLPAEVDEFTAFVTAQRPASGGLKGPIPLADTWDGWCKIRTKILSSDVAFESLWTKEDWGQHGIVNRTLRLALGALIYVPGIGFYEYSNDGTGLWATQPKRNDDIAARWAARAMKFACEAEASEYDDTQEINEKTGKPKAGSSEVERFQKAMRPVANMTNGAATLLRQMAPDLGIEIPADRFDKVPHLFAAANGVVDLRDGSIRTPTMADLLTKVSAVAYDPTMPTPHWNRFLESAHPDAEVRAFLQKALGYSLTGEHGEHRMFIHYGATTANGKSVLMNTLSSILGGHMGAASSKVIVKQRSGSAAIGQDVVDMGGFRMLVLNETDEGAHLDDAAVKSLTAADIRADRAHYEGNRQHRVTGTLHLVTNHLPHITPDLAMRRRLTVIPWTQSFAANPDPYLEAKLATELPGILAWLVEGAKQWYADTAAKRPALVEPDLCAKALDRFFEEEDEVGDWARSEAMFLDADGDPKGWTPAKDLYVSYRNWRFTQALSGKEMSAVAFGRRLTALGLDAKTAWLDGRSVKVRPLRLNSTLGAGSLL